MIDPSVRLEDIGERRILREIIPRYVTGAGDDCADLGPIEGSVVVTTDPVPVPAASVLAGDNDLYWVGWLLVTINASDIAAAGAKPSSFVAALEMPSSLQLADLIRLLEGINDSCRVHGFKYVGGNLREAERVGGVGTALGCIMVSPLTRAGASGGDKILCIGEGGRFWSDVARIREGHLRPKADSPVYAPVAQTRIMHELNSQRLLLCAMDTSDGLSPALQELSLTNQCGIVVHTESLIDHKGDSSEASVRNWLAWGDWNVIVACKPTNEVKVHEHVCRLGGTSRTIGQFETALTGVHLSSPKETIEMTLLDSERFSKESWFRSGLERYEKLMQMISVPSI